MPAPLWEAAKAAGAYVVTQWNKPADLHPWDFDPNYVAHISFSGVPYGKAMAEALIKAWVERAGSSRSAASSRMSQPSSASRPPGSVEGHTEVKLLDMQVA
jgi:ribose transport system substrate-binding protein